MKKILLIGVSLALMAAAAFPLENKSPKFWSESAFETPSRPATAEGERLFEQEFGFEYFSFTYREPTLMNDTGMMPSIIYSIAYRKGFMAALDARYTDGLVNYDGGTDAGPLKISDIPDHSWELRVLGGYTFPFYWASKITPYFGAGRRFLSDNSQQRSASGYSRESNYFYTPIGVETDFALEDGARLTIVAEKDSFTNGLQKTFLSDYDPAYNDLENWQDSGSGYRWSISYQYRSGNRDCEIKLFERFWDIEESEHEIVTKNGVPYAEAWEPKNNTTELGVSAVIKF